MAAGSRSKSSRNRSSESSETADPKPPIGGETAGAAPRSGFAELGREVSSLTPPKVSRHPQEKSARDALPKQSCNVVITFVIT